MADTDTGDALKLLFVKLGLDVPEADIKKANQTYTELKSKIDLVVGAARMAWSVVSQFTLAFSEQAMQARATAQQLGVTVQRLQELQHAANVNESSAEAMTRGLLFLGRYANAAATGSKEAALNFQRLGISVRDTGGKLKDPAALMYEVSEAFAKMPDGTQKAALAMQLFGRGGAELIPTLNLGAAGLREAGAEARELGVVLTDQALAAAVKFDNEADTLKAALVGLRNIIGVELMPVATEFARALVTWIKANREWIRSRFVEALQVTVSVLKTLKQLLDPVAAVFLTVAKNGAIFWTLVGMLAGGGVIRAALGIGQLVTALQALRLAHLSAAGAAMAQNAAVVLLGLKWLAIGAIVALVMEDLYTYVTGGDSMIGLLVEKVGNLESALWQAFIAPHEGDWWVVAKLRDAARYIDNLANEYPVAFQLIKNVLSAPLDLMTGRLGLKAATAAKGIYQAASGQEYSEDVRRFMYGSAAGPTESFATSTQSLAAGASAKVLLQPNVTINVPVQSNANPADIANAIRPVVRDELSTVLRDAASAHE